MSTFFFLGSSFVFLRAFSLIGASSVDFDALFNLSLAAGPCFLLDEGVGGEDLEVDGVAFGLASSLFFFVTKVSQLSVDVWKNTVSSNRLVPRHDL